MISSDEYRELIEFLGKQFGKVTGQLEHLNGRLMRLEINHEAMRDDLKGLADGIVGNRGAIDRNAGSIAKLDGKLDRLDLGFRGWKQRRVPGRWVPPLWQLSAVVRGSI